MANLLKDGWEWLGEELHSHASSDVTYLRGEQSVTLSATVGRSTFEVDDGQGGIIPFESRDYVMRTADLSIGGSAVLPEQGDIIRETVGLRTYDYQVLTPGMVAGANMTTEPCWRYSDPYRTTLRVHTKKVDDNT